MADGPKEQPQLVDKYKTGLSTDNLFHAVIQLSVARCRVASRIEETRQLGGRKCGAEERDGKHESCCWVDDHSRLAVRPEIDAHRDLGQSVRVKQARAPKPPIHAVCSQYTHSDVVLPLGKGAGANPAHVPPADARAVVGFFFNDDSRRTLHATESPAQTGKASLASDAIVMHWQQESLCREVPRPKPAKRFKHPLLGVLQV